MYFSSLLFLLFCWFFLHSIIVLLFVVVFFIFFYYALTFLRFAFFHFRGTIDPTERSPESEAYSVLKLLEPTKNMSMLKTHAYA